MTYQGLKQWFTDSMAYRIVYAVISLLTIFIIFKVFQDLRGFVGIRKPMINVLLGLSFALFVFKLLFGGMQIIYDGGRYLLGLVKYVFSFFSDTSDGNFVPSRRKAVSQIMTVGAGIPFLALIYGVTKGKYQYVTERVSLYFDDLPDAFDGYKLVQISDIHAGSFDSYEQVMKGIDMVNQVNPDLVVFTGDLVNSDKDEIDPYLSAFKKISAKDGKFSISGNHDYYGMRDVANKDQYWNEFIDKHTQMGFTILNNESVSITKNGQSIQLVGVENWGKGPFPKMGDLDKALTNISDADFKLLLSHDPTHWEEKVIPHKQKVHLTLSGHTHGMQFGIAALGIKWSPVKWRYKRWMGLYEENNQKLYINRGFGFLGFPGRVGMWPEITEITLKKKMA